MFRLLVATLAGVVVTSSQNARAEDPELATKTNRPTMTTPQRIGVVLGGVGIAALSGGFVFGGIAMSRGEEAKDAARACPGHVCPTEASRALAVRAVDDATGYANAANVAFGVGLALVVATIVLMSTGEGMSTLWRGAR